MFAALLVLSGCSSTEEVVVSDVQASLPVAQTSSSLAVFTVNYKDENGNDSSQIVIANAGAVKLGDYIYAAGQGDLGYEITSMNQARSSTMQLLAEYVNTAIVSAGENYAAGGGLANSSSATDFQSVVNNAVGTRTVARAQISGIEYVDYRAGEGERVYILARVPAANIDSEIKKTAEDILRKDAAVQANQEATNFFTRLTNEGIF